MKDLGLPPKVIPNQGPTSLGDLFGKECFGEVDSNIMAWLPSSWAKSEPVSVIANEFEQPLNNEELVQALGGLKSVIRAHLFTPAQIVHLVERSTMGSEALQKNGYQNLFFVYNQETGNVYLLGVVYDLSISKWVPYIYRLRNLYRSWSRGNRVFLRYRQTN